MQVVTHRLLTIAKMKKKQQNVNVITQFLQILTAKSHI